MTETMVALYINEFCGMTGYVSPPSGGGYVYTIRYHCETRIICSASELSFIIEAHRAKLLEEYANDFNKCRAVHCAKALEMLAQVSEAEVTDENNR